MHPPRSKDKRSGVQFRKKLFKKDDGPETMDYGNPRETTAIEIW